MKLGVAGHAFDVHQKEEPKTMTDVKKPHALPLSSDSFTIRAGKPGEGKGRVALEMARAKQRVAPPPRYDEVFAEGVKWLDSLAGDMPREEMISSDFPRCDPNPTIAPTPPPASNVRVIHPALSAPRFLALTESDPIARGLTARALARVSARMVEIHGEICEKEAFRLPACAHCGEAHLCADHLIAYSAAKEDVERLERAYANLAASLKNLVQGL